MAMSPVDPSTCMLNLEPRGVAVLAVPTHCKNFEEFLDCQAFRSPFFGMLKVELTSVFSHGEPCKQHGALAMGSN